MRYIVLQGQTTGSRQKIVLSGFWSWSRFTRLISVPTAQTDPAGASVIVEAGLRDLSVTPSQGTHFFQNLTSFNVGYFTVNPETGDGTIDWDWLYGQPARSAAEHVRHVRLAEPVLVLMNGKKNEGLILKP